MTICLYECLKAVGLQRHYARFTSLGVCSADLISGLSMEDYPLLGIRSMEDRTRLFHLVQLIKNHDPKSLAYDDECNESYSAVDGSSPVDYGNPDKDVNEDQDESGAAISNPDVASFARPSNVCRRLNFNDESTELQKKLFPHPEDVHPFTGLERNKNPVQGKGSAIPVQLQLPNRNEQLYSDQESSNCKLDVYTSCCLCECHDGKNNQLDIRGGNSTLNSTKLTRNSETFNKLKCSSASVKPKTFDNNPFKHKDKNNVSWNKSSYTDIAKFIPVFEAQRTAGYNYGLPLSSTHHPRKKHVGGQRISVFVRKRPLIQTECRRGEKDVLTTPGGECVIVHENKQAVDLTHYILQHKFYFDQAFGDESSNEEVYQRATYPLVQHMLSGGKSTCFAYGQTGAGKTYTMLGLSPEKPGLYALAVRDIFTHLSTTYKYSSLLVYVSFFEIYCGQLYDLLDHRKRLFAREDGQKVVHISRLRDVRVDSVSSLLEVISQGTAERTQGMSGVNPFSSRSHALLQIQLRDSNQQIAGRMWFVDLAGSERASDAKEPDKQSRIEGAEINQSLLALKECIRSLDREESYTPFRQSKLTLVLKDSFVGDSMTCMIANVSPGQSATEHTLNTLRYADRVKELRGPERKKGRRVSKMVPSPQHSGSKSNSSSSVGMPNTTKLREKNEDFGSNTPTTKLHTGSRLFCSTPTNNICGEEIEAVARKGIGLEYVKPVRVCLAMDVKSDGSKGTNEREPIRVKTHTKTHNHFTGEKSVRAVLEQENNEQIKQKETHKPCLAFTEREPGFYNRGRGSWQRSIKETRGQEVEWVEPVENTSREVARQSQRGLNIYTDDMERKRHLRCYHQKLQQFKPSSESPSAHSSPSLTCSTSSSCVQGSVSSPEQSSHPSLSTQMYPALGDTSAACGVGVARAGYDIIPSSKRETCRQTETSLNFWNDKNTDALCNCGSSEDSRVFLEDIQTCVDWCQNRKRASIKARGEAKTRRAHKSPSGVKGVERKCSWVAATQVEPANSVISPISTETQLSYSCILEKRKETDELDTSGIPNDGVWRTKQKEAADCSSMEKSYGFCSHPPYESQNQQAPAERPLSPPYERTYTLLTPSKPCETSIESNYITSNANICTSLLQNAPHATIQRKKVPYSFCATLPVATIMTKAGCMIPAESPSKCSVYAKAYSCPDTNSKKSVLLQDGTCVDSFSYIMDPLSISLLPVDQPAGTTSALQENNSNTSACPAEMKSGDINRCEIEKKCLPCAEMESKLVEDAKYLCSLLEQPQEKTLHSTDNNHTERQIFIKNNVFGIGPKKPEFTSASIQKQGDRQKTHTIPAYNKNVSASPLKSASFASAHTPVRLASVQQFDNTDLRHFQNPPVYACDENRKDSFSITTQHSGSSAHASKLSDQSSHSYISPKPNNPTELSRQKPFSNQDIRPTVHLLTLEDLNHIKWCIVKAHLEQIKDMEALCCKEKKLLYQQHDMAFGEYIHRLAEIMERKSRCAHIMKTQLQPYLKHINSMKSQTKSQRENDHDPVM